jgi:hypothetical protein
MSNCYCFGLKLNFMPVGRLDFGAVQQKDDESLLDRRAGWKFCPNVERRID